MAKKFISMKVDEETHKLLKEISEKEMIKISRLVSALAKGEIFIKKNKTTYDLIKNN